eukprot:5283832-Karenia_brevis.AAC.1
MQDLVAQGSGPLQCGRLLPLGHASSVLTDAMKDVPAIGSTQCGSLPQDHASAAPQDASSTLPRI